MDQETQLMRKLVLTPCSTKEGLGQWLRMFIGLDFPDQKIDESSTSSPLDYLWEVYDAGVNRRPLKMDDGSDSRRAMIYASRDSFKSLAASVLELLAMIHMDRNVIHTAAIEDQAGKVTEYLRTALEREWLEDFKIGDNKRTIAVLWFENKTTGDILNNKEWKIPGSSRRDYIRHVHYVKVLVNTPQSCNCIDPETLITIEDGSLKTAESIKQGELVRSLDLRVTKKDRNRKIVTNRVGEVGRIIKNSMRISFEGGGSVVMSEDHAVFTTSGWVRARALMIGDRCWRPNDSFPSDSQSNIVCIKSACDNPESALLGTMLGDSSMCWPKAKGKKYGKGPRYSCNHCKAQIDYLTRKAEILTAFGVSNITIDDAREQKKLMSRVSEKLIPMYEMLYGTGKKTISQEVLDRLDWEALAFWFMDDGSGCCEIVGTGKSRDKPMSLATCCFSIEENQLIVDVFKSKFGLESSIGTVSNGKRYYPVIRLTLESSRKLSAMVDQYLSPCLKYKFTTPVEMIGGRCLDCGRPTDRFTRKGFSFCSTHDLLINGQSQWKRDTNRELKRGCNSLVSKIEYLGPRELCTIHIDTQEEHLKNFIANSLILLHNSDHTSFLCVDEVDLIRFPKAYEEAKFIPSAQKDPYGRIQPPITILTSTRKSSGGLVQKEIDEGQKTKTLVRHWNILDVTQACPPERHRPDLPRETRWYSDATLMKYTDVEFQDLLTRDPKAAAKCASIEVSAGCSNCSILAACKGRLASQKSKAGLLKDINDTIAKFSENSVEMCLAQLLCLKPGNEGAIYPHFSRETHMLSVEDMWKEITGEEAPQGVNKQSLVDLLQSRGADCHSGMDFGCTHCFAVVTGWKDGRRIFILDSFEIPGLELNGCIDLCDQRIKSWGPTVWPDVAYPAYIKTFTRNGYRMRNHTKDVIGGIAAVRSKIMPVGIGRPEIWLLRDDPGCEELAKRIVGYKWKLDQAGQPTEIPDKDQDDSLDALRYLIQNTFKGAGKIIIGHTEEKKPIVLMGHGDAPRMTEKSWMTDTLKELTGVNYAPASVQQDKKKKKGFFYSI
jgi:hypothetical protein